MLSTAKKWAPLLVLSLALAIIVIDTTLLNVSLETIIRDLNTDIQHLQWVITAYSLVLAALTITGGRFGDIFGRKRMFMLGAAIFAVGSFITSISQSVPVLISGESIVEGIGAILMMPATASLLVSTYRGRDRAIAFGVWGGVAAAAAAIGPVLGGWLTTNYNWRWGFRINIVVAAVLLLGSVLVRESWDRVEKPKIDWWGVVLSVLGLLGITYGIIEASTYGWLKAKTAFTFFGTQLNLPGNLSISVFAIIWGIILLAAFILWELLLERRQGTPLVSTRLFKNRRFTSGILTTGIMGLGQSGMFFALPVYFQAVRGLDAFHTGLSLLPMPLSLLIAAPLSSFLSKKIYPRTLVIIGLIVSALAYVVLILSLSTTASAWHLAPGLILYGIGMGFVIAQISNITLSAVSVEEAGEASGVNNTFRQLGSTFGSAIIGSILLTVISASLVSGIKSSTNIPAGAKDPISQAVQTQISSVEFGLPTHLGSLSPAAQAEIASLGHQATVDGNRIAFIGALVFTLLGLVAAYRLPKELNVEHNVEA